MNFEYEFNISKKLAHITIWWLILLPWFNILHL